jgi:phenylacetate-coenzyme A ligase PaaK-like adenylate-forming protein
LVRYAIKDYGSMTREACGCDNPWHRILSLEGRKQDLFYAPDGRKISPNAMVHFCWAYGMEYGTQVQMVQRDVDHLEVHLLKIEKEKPRDEAFEATMRWELETLFRVPLTIDICWKKEMAYTPTGKYRMIQRQIERLKE